MKKRRSAGRPTGDGVRAAVLAQTLAELADRGIEQLSIERIAQAAHVNKTSIYRRWPTREILVVAALEQVLDDFSLSLKDSGSLRADLYALAKAIAALLEQPLGRELARAAFLDAFAAPLAELARTRLHRASGPAVDMLARAIARGEWRADLAPQMLLSLLVGPMLHRVMLERADLSKAWLVSLVDALVLGAQPRGPISDRDR